jgi:ATP-binding cassette subfamily B protein RaxB
VRCEVFELADLQLPAILHWNLNHFVVLRRVMRDGIEIHDPAQGVCRISLREASKRFSGAAVELTRTPEFKKRKERSPLRLMSLMRFTPALTGGLAQTFILSLLLQAYILASPFYIQLAIDQGALKGDTGLLGALAIGFGLLGLFNVAATALRAVALQKLSAQLGWDMTRRVFHHMLRLPLPWFQRRRLADSLTRFESIEPVRALISGGLIATAIDGLLASLTLIMMFVFSPKLALVALIGVLIYLAIRLACLPLTIRLAAETLMASIAEQGKRIETLRAIQTIKAMGAETMRESDWQNRYADTVRAEQRSVFSNVAITSAQSLIESVVLVAIIYMGASLIINNLMTVGTLFAFMAYKTQFTQRAQGLFEQLVNWKMLDLHSDRLSDIVLSPKEPGLDAPVAISQRIKGAVELRAVSFRYSPQDVWVLQGISAKIEAGEFVAIVGPSGAGKSTLLKLLCGLYPVSAGEILVDGLPLSSWGPRNLRRQLGVVMQDDELLAGSIADNVSFFDEEVDMSRVWSCLAMAAIDQEVMAMPMRADTFVGDMGTALSGGQKQRILLARALYKQPSILVLDEATSHLDLSREREINDALRSQTVTRIVVAHRPETVAAADRVLKLVSSNIYGSARAREQVANIDTSRPQG